jgi:hypothetical protein
VAGACSRGGLGLYLAGVVSVHLDGHGWARGAALLEGRYELGAALGVARSGVHWSGYGAGVFRMVTREMAHGAVSWDG